MGLASFSSSAGGARGWERERDGKERAEDAAYHEAPLRSYPYPLSPLLVVYLWDWFAGLAAHAARGSKCFEDALLPP